MLTEPSLKRLEWLHDGVSEGSAAEPTACYTRTLSSVRGCALSQLVREREIRLVYPCSFRRSRTLACTCCSSTGPTLTYPSPYVELLVPSLERKTDSISRLFQSNQYRHFPSVTYLSYTRARVKSSFVHEYCY